MTLDKAGLLLLAERAARAAAAPILEVYGSDFAVRVKEDRSPVTLADERAEAMIIEALAAAAPDIAVIAEERVAAEGAGAAPERFWLVDPLDGTREFVRRNGEFTTNIALVAAGRVVLGVVHLPIRNLTYCGMGPGTATRREGAAEPVAIRARAAPARQAVVIHSRSHADHRIDAYLAALAEPERRVMGSAAKFCIVAEGEADFYPRFGTTMEWDTAAGQAVLEAAGGAVLTLDGAPLGYGKPLYRNPHFIARGLGAR
ncbi:MAG: 3'(2'),5'-bisphosphate nucleotidase CysQ [Stellaceae bacterium]